MLIKNRPIYLHELMIAVFANKTKKESYETIDGVAWIYFKKSYDNPGEIAVKIDFQDCNFLKDDDHNPGGDPKEMIAFFEDVILALKMVTKDNGGLVLNTHDKNQG